MENFVPVILYTLRTNRIPSRREFLSKCTQSIQYHGHKILHESPLKVEWEIYLSGAGRMQLVIFGSAQFWCDVFDRLDVIFLLWISMILRVGHFSGFSYRDDLIKCYSFAKSKYVVIFSIKMSAVKFLVRKCILRYYFSLQIFLYMVLKLFLPCL